ncbi:MAG: polysaccharide deacetylase family protein [Bacteroidetes bacterium]|nr:polysaccharide deacetylase family protein [Bacteroidota bacterium]
MTKLLSIFTPKITGRNKYMFRLFFRELMGLDISVTNDARKFSSEPGPKLCYSTQPVGDALFFYSRNLLFESGIADQNISVFEWNGQKVFFATGKSSALPFDPFAAAFYMVSRYEEYLPHIRDNIDRFDAKNSLAWQHGFLMKPVVNQWAIMVKHLLSEKYPELNFGNREYRFTPTLDIDNAYAYRQKGFMRTLGGYVKSFFHFDFSDMRSRTKVLLRLQRDPYDTYAYQLALQKKYSLRPVYFFLVGDYGVNDKNLSVQNRKFRELIRHIADYSDVGVHPSFASARIPSRLKTESGRLKNILHADISRSRQHFLMLKFPDTYRNLIDADITDDYTMGFANEIGFRAGISSTFNFYDLDLESETSLRIHPFALMDATLNLYMHLTPDEATQKINELVDEVKKVNGEFVSLWHNETLSDEKQWKGWREVYEKLIEKAAVTVQPERA